MAALKPASPRGEQQGPAPALEGGVAVIAGSAKERQLLAHEGFTVLEEVSCGPEQGPVMRGLLLRRTSKLKPDKQQAAASPWVLYVRCLEPCCATLPRLHYSQEGCIFTGNSFEAHAGLSSRKNWKASIRMAASGHSLRDWLASAVKRAGAAEAAVAAEEEQEHEAEQAGQALAALRAAALPTPSNSAAAPADSASSGTPPGACSKETPHRGNPGWGLQAPGRPGAQGGASAGGQLPVFLGAAAVDPVRESVVRPQAQPAAGPDLLPSEQLDLLQQYPQQYNPQYGQQYSQQQQYNQQQQYSQQYSQQQQHYCQAPPLKQESPTQWLPHLTPAQLHAGAFGAAQPQPYHHQYQQQGQGQQQQQGQAPASVVTDSPAGVTQPINSGAGDARLLNVAEWLAQQQQQQQPIWRPQPQLPSTPRRSAWQPYSRSPLAQGAAGTAWAQQAQQGDLEQPGAKALAALLAALQAAAPGPGLAPPEAAAAAAAAPLLPPYSSAGAQAGLQQSSPAPPAPLRLRSTAPRHADVNTLLAGPAPPLPPLLLSYPVAAAPASAAQAAGVPAPQGPPLGQPPSEGELRLEVGHIKEGMGALAGQYGALVRQYAALGARAAEGERTVEALSEQVQALQQLVCQQQQQQQQQLGVLPAVPRGGGGWATGDGGGQDASEISGSSKRQRLG